MKKARVGFDVGKQRSEEIRRRYNVEVKNRFEVLGDITDPEEELTMRFWRCIEMLPRKLSDGQKIRASHG